MLKGPVFYDNDFFSIASENKGLIERLKRLLLTVPGERVNKPEYGSRLKMMIFESAEVVYNSLPFIVKEDIERWEPTVRVDDIRVAIDESKDHKIAKLTILLFDLQNKEELEYELQLNI